MSKKCLLISSPRIGRTFPRGIMQIASYLEANACPTEVLPLAYYLHPPGARPQDLTPEDEGQIEDILAAAIRRTNPLVVGISNPYTMGFHDCLKVLALCKRIDERVITVIGGPHVTFQDVECLTSPQVDVVVRGEGEWTMLDLMTSLEKGRDLAGVLGITFKRNGGIVRTPDRPLGDLGELPPINFELLPSEYVRQASVFGVSNRGCVYRCNYCVERIFWKRKRRHPVAKLVAEMETLARRYDNQMCGFFESMLDTRSGQLVDLCAEIVNRGIQLPPDFPIHVRGDCVSARD